jgi:hypothetical protein
MDQMVKCLLIHTDPLTPDGGAEQSLELTGSQHQYFAISATGRAQVLFREACGYWPYPQGRALQLHAITLYYPCKEGDLQCQATNQL